MPFPYLGDAHSVAILAKNETPCLVTTGVGKEPKPRGLAIGADPNAKNGALAVT